MTRGYKYAGGVAAMICPACKDNTMTFRNRIAVALRNKGVCRKCGQAATPNALVSALLGVISFMSIVGLALFLLKTEVVSLSYAAWLIAGACILSIAVHVLLVAAFAPLVPRSALMERRVRVYALATAAVMLLLVIVMLSRNRV